MITLGNRFFPVRSAVCFFVEGGIILVSVLASFLLLQRWGGVTIIDLHDAIVRGVVVAFFCQSCMYLLDMYDLKHLQKWGDLFFSLVLAVGVVCIGIGLVTYVVPEFGVEGSMYYLTILFVATFLLFWRISFDIYLHQYSPKEKILMLGTGEAAQLLGREIRQWERLGFQLAGFVSIDPETGNNVAGIGPLLGDASVLVDLAKKHRVKKVVVALNERRGGYPIGFLLDLKVHGCDVVEWTTFFEMLAGRIPVDNLAPSYFIFQSGFRKSILLLFTRWLLSLMAALALLFILFPLIAVTALLIKIDSPGPVFYTQERVGRRGKIFRIVKFRSMRVDAESAGAAIWASENDPRITRVGKWIRRARIDEIPQLWNVLKGDIEVVGPRPERPEFVRKLEKMFPYYSLRHTISPGLTGWAQVMFSYCGTIEESKEKLQYDLFYIKNMSVKLDLLILFRTVKIVLLGRGAR
ncbi:MAG: TIGR03013 family PEP-CTERM/XrtA system glycosyltransferase [Deltaproteobacteria bacterium]|nr:MAG: TIGR03013 family PEP-CTERM/XrtA system glycosyltransferase [Deltaproteobacteria bacterium]